jgi:CheY-like chemotaxis protein
MPISTPLLVIEPHENLRDAYASVLRFAGYPVEESACAVSAGVHLSSIRPRVVLMNPQLPTAGDGLRLLRRYRREPALRSTIWIAVCDSGDGLSMAERQEFDAVLPMPIRYADLIGIAAAFAEESAAPAVAPEMVWDVCFS